MPKRAPKAPLLSHKDTGKPAPRLPAGGAERLLTNTCSRWGCWGEGGTSSFYVVAVKGLSKSKKLFTAHFRAVLSSFRSRNTTRPLEQHLQFGPLPLAQLLLGTKVIFRVNKSIQGIIQLVSMSTEKTNKRLTCGKCLASSCCSCCIMAGENRNKSCFHVLSSGASPLDLNHSSYVLRCPCQDLALPAHPTWRHQLVT